MSRPIRKRGGELATKIKELRGRLNQTEFADLVGVPATHISQWESGKRKLASAKACNLLGNFAARQKLFDLAFWFWEQAKLDRQALLTAASDSLKGRSAPAGHGEIVRLRLMRGIVGQGNPDSAPQIRFHASVIPHPDETSYVRVPEESFVLPILHVGDYLVIDSSERDPWKLEGSLVAAYRPPEEINEQVQKEFLRSHPPKEVEQRRQMGLDPFLRVGLFVGHLQGRPVGEDSLGLYIVGMKGNEVQPVGHHAGYYKEKGPEARFMFGPQILGRVLSWIDSTSEASERRRRRLDAASV